MRGGLLLLFLILLTPWLTPYEPDRSVTLPWQTPCSLHWLGTDGLGRDVLSRVMNGGWSILLLPLASALLASLLGSLIGLLLLALPNRGRQWITAFNILLILPPLLVMLLVFYALGTGPVSLLLCIVLLNAPFTARYVRALADPMLDHSYVDVARAAGDSYWLLLWRELLPGLTAALCTDLGTRLVGGIYLMSAVSFLGVGNLSQQGNWASMVSEGLQGLALNPYATLIPALCITLTIVVINLTAQRQVAR